jgi:hypothetical protein
MINHEVPVALNVQDWTEVDFPGGRKNYPKLLFQTLVRIFFFLLSCVIDLKI